MDQLALAAVEPVTNGMVVGLGTGRAAARGIRALGDRVTREHLTIQCAATSLASAALGRELGLVVVSLGDVARIDYLFDGADEVDPELRMIKGGGGAMTREKVAAHAAHRRVYLVQEEKLSARLGQRHVLPIEVLGVAEAFVCAKLHAFGLSVAQRRAGRTQKPIAPLTRGDDVFRTDDGNLVFDARLTPDMAVDVDALAGALDAMPGVVGHGLFVSEADEVIVEDAQGDIRRLPRGGSIDRG